MGREMGLMGGDLRRGVWGKRLGKKRGRGGETPEEDGGLGVT